MFANVKVATRLSLGFGVVLMLLITISWLSVLRLGTVSDAATLIMEDRYPKVQLAEGIRTNAIHNGRLLGGLLLASTEAEANSLRQQASAYRDKNTEILKRLDGALLADRARQLLEEVKDKRATLSPMYRF